MGGVCGRTNLVGARACTPAAIKELQSEVLLELWRRFRNLELIFGVPREIHVTPPTVRPPREDSWMLPRDHPAVSIVATEGEEASEQEVTSGHDDPIQRMPALSRFGKLFMDSMLEEWWASRS